MSSSSSSSSALLSSNDAFVSMEEATPLLNSSSPVSEETLENKLSSTNRSSLLAFTILCLLGITVILGFDSITSLSKVTKLATSLQAASSETPSGAPCDVHPSGVSFCPGFLPGTYQNVHLKPGCVMLSVNDLTTMGKNPSYSNSPILTVCASMSSGVVMVDNALLQKYNLASASHSHISSILFSDDTQIKLFSGKNFDGSVIGSNGTPYKDPYTKILGLTQQKYTSEPFEPVNDNVYSFLFATSSVEMNSCLHAMEFK